MNKKIGILMILTLIGMISVIPIAQAGIIDSVLDFFGLGDEKEVIVEQEKEVISLTKEEIEKVRYYKTETVKEPIINITKVYIPEIIIDKDHKIEASYKIIKNVTGYINVQKQIKTKQNYLGIELNGTKLEKVVLERNGKMYQYKNDVDNKTFCKDCRCREYEQKAGICWEVKQ